MTGALSRLLSHVSAEPNTGCWLVDLAEQTGGYAQFKMSGKPVRAHRASWLLHRGAIPLGIEVCHRCDTPSCVNPEHLFLGTRRENVQDCIQKGRFVRPAITRPRSTHCHKGHEYAVTGARRTRRGHVSECAECRRARLREAWATSNQRAIRRGEVPADSATTPTVNSGEAEE